jgi:SpoVK/Ycf46/Vps4 family AAA+-type ATPase
VHQVLRTEITLAVRARYPVLNLVTWEEERACALLREIAADTGKQLVTWTSARGFSDQPRRGARSEPADPRQALERVEASPDRALFALLDFHPFLEEPTTCRLLRDVAGALEQSYKTLILVTPVLDLPVELEKDVAVFDLPLPTEAELEATFRAFVQGTRTDRRLRIADSPDLVEKVVKASMGLTLREADNVYCKALVQDKVFDESDIPMIVHEKKQIIRKTGLLDFHEAEAGLGDIGGLVSLKRWLLLRQEAFSQRARDYGLPQPKGVLLLGVQGCGKSLSAKAISSLWNLPLLRLDVGTIFGSFIGQSEANMRRAISIAESLSPCVLWLDEIEKGLGGGTGGPAGDAGVAARVFSTFLTWLQEKTRPVFVVATANRIDELPPELLRKGRFDEIFFVDLPGVEERDEIFRIHLARRHREPSGYDTPALADATEGFSGAEIEEVVTSALYSTFPDHLRDPTRDIETEDLHRAIQETVPLSVTMAEEITRLRAWCAHRARPASPPGRREQRP